MHKIRLSQVREDGMFRPVLGPGIGLENQIRVMENTDTAGAKGRLTNQFFNTQHQMDVMGVGGFGSGCYTVQAIRNITC